MLLVLLGLPGRALASAGDGTGVIQGEVRIVPSSIGSRVASPEAALVYLEDGPPGPMPRGPFEVSQSGKAFLPPVLVVPRGATVAFPNLDPILHNVFSVTPGDSFDLGLHKTGDAPTAVLEKAGIVSVYCNIHSQMVGYLVVVTNPFFVHPGTDGRYALPPLPPGDYHAVAWFPFGPLQRQDIRVRPGEKVKLDFVLRERNDAGRHSKKDGSRYGQY